LEAWYDWYYLITFEADLGMSWVRSDWAELYDRIGNVIGV